MSSFRIAERAIGVDEPPYLIAEISANHRGSLAGAIELVHAAAEAGADAVKLQHYTPDTITVRSEHPDFLVTGGTLWDGRQLADLYAEAMTPWEWTDDLAAAADAAGISWFSTPFDTTAADFLMRYDVPAFKIASFEIVDLPLIRYVAGLGKPMIISTGMATLPEIDAAVEAATGASGAAELAVLRCNSGYPAAPGEMDLRAISTMQDRWQLPIGLSDHTLGSTAAIAAVALGACIVEKHLTLHRSDGGPDAAFSAEPDEFRSLVAAVREAHLALGATRFGPSEREVANLAFRRSLRAARPIAAGTTLTVDDVRSMRPAGGLAPDHLSDVIGSTARIDLAVGDPIRWSDLLTDEAE
jgi:pseudaminic acid synthase